MGLLNPRRGIIPTLNEIPDVVGTNREISTEEGKRLEGAF